MGGTAGSFDSLWSPAAFVRSVSVGPCGVLFVAGAPSSFPWIPLASSVSFGTGPRRTSLRGTSEDVDGLPAGDRGAWRVDLGSRHSAAAILGSSGDGSGVNQTLGCVLAGWMDGWFRVGCRRVANWIERSGSRFVLIGLRRVGSVGPSPPHLHPPRRSFWAMRILVFSPPR